MLAACWDSSTQAFDSQRRTSPTSGAHLHLPTQLPHITLHLRRNSCKTLRTILDDCRGSVLWLLVELIFSSAPCRMCFTSKESAEGFPILLSEVAFHVPINMGFEAYAWTRVRLSI